MLFGIHSEKLRRQVAEAEDLLKQQEQQSDRYNGREDDPQVPRQLRQSRHRRPLPEHLPREIHRLEPAEVCCPECGNGMEYLSEVSAEQLELVSSALKVIRTVRVKKACVRCDCIVEAPAPSRPIDRGIAGPGLLARMLTTKYCEHLPLYRQTEIFARQGGDLSRALLSNRVDTCCRLMAPLNDAPYNYVMGATNCTPMIHRCRYWHRGERRRKQGESGRLCVMTETQPRLLRQRCGSHTHRTGRGSILSNIFVITMAYCRLMRSQGTTGCSAQNETAAR